MRHLITPTLLMGLLLGHAGMFCGATHAQYADRSFSRVPVPGTGTKIDYVGDDFEASDWRFVHNMPKSSSELNERTYGPMAYSVNRRWAEGPMRGQPDVLKVIQTPPGGLAGSAQALQITTLRSRDSRCQHQRRSAGRLDHERRHADRFDDPGGRDAELRRASLSAGAITLGRPIRPTLRYPLGRSHHDQKAA